MYLVELARALHPRCRGVIRAYADESEKKDLGVFTVAGCVLTAGQCGPFERRWRRILESAPRPLTEFKAADFISGRGEFTGWTARERVGIYRELSKVAYTLGRFSLSASVDPRALSAICPEESPYFLATTVFTQIVMRHFRDKGPISLFFDRGRKGHGRVEEFLQKAKNSSKQYPEFSQLIGSYSRVDSKVAPQIQLADMIAWRTAWEAVIDLRRSTVGVNEFSRELIAKTKILVGHTIVLNEQDLRQIYIERKFFPFDCCSYTQTLDQVFTG